MVTFIVQQGATSPRTGEIGWRNWAEYADADQAKRAAKALGLARVLKSECVAEYKQGKRLVGGDRA